MLFFRDRYLYGLKSVKIEMPPIKTRKTWREFAQERKNERKQRKLEKLLKKGGFIERAKKDVQVEVKEIEHRPKPKPEPTVSIAVPGSIMNNAQSRELKTYLAGQIARAACIYKVDEVIVYDDMSHTSKQQTDFGLPNQERNTCLQFGRILQYCECPQYLRKSLIPIQKDLQFCGLISPLDAPHHLRQSDDFPYREGVTTNKKQKYDRGVYVDIGLRKEVAIDKNLEPGIRVTVKLTSMDENKKKWTGILVPPYEPRQELGVYWGYTVRLAKSFSDVFMQCPYEEGYDFTIGTSDKGTPVNEINDSELKPFKHYLIVFGGLAGLESVLESDETLPVNDVTLFFDKYINTCPGQGSRTIRTEEALLISLAELVKKFEAPSTEESGTE